MPLLVRAISQSTDESCATDKTKADRDSSAGRYLGCRTTGRTTSKLGRRSTMQEGTRSESQSLWAGIGPCLSGFWENSIGNQQDLSDLSLPGIRHHHSRPGCVLGAVTATTVGLDACWRAAHHISIVVWDACWVRPPPLQSAWMCAGVLDMPPPQSACWRAGHATATVGLDAGCTPHQHIRLGCVRGLWRFHPGITIVVAVLRWRGRSCGSAALKPVLRLS